MATDIAETADGSHTKITKLTKIAKTKCFLVILVIFVSAPVGCLSNDSGDDLFESV